MKTLTIKQEKFAQSYIESGNATQAYRTAYNAEKMQDATVNVKACELLDNGAVKPFAFDSILNWQAIDRQNLNPRSVQGGLYKPLLSPWHWQKFSGLILSGINQGVLTASFLVEISRYQLVVIRPN